MLIRSAQAGLAVLGLTLGGCNVLLGLSDYAVDDAPPLGSGTSHLCRAHSECPAPAGPASATFCTTKRRCVSLQSEDCSRIAGDALDPHAVVVGALFATTGPDAELELARQRAVQLAVEEINAHGGIPARDRPEPRSMLLLACDATSNLDRATTQLTSAGARAILGLSDSEQLLQVVRAHAIAAGIVTLSTAIAPESINSLLDADLAWLMSLTVEQRAKLLDTALGALEQHLAAERSEPLRVALLFRYDGAGRAGLAALRDHELDGHPLGVPDLHAGRVRVDRLPDTELDLQALAASYRAFAPDIILMLGAADLQSRFIAPLEQALARDAASVRPHYLFSELAKGPGLLELARQLPSLRDRVHGVGSAVPALSRAASQQFQRRYQERFDSDASTAPRVAAAYDSVYALAYAIAAIEPEHEVGGRIAQALHWLEDPEQTAAPIYEVGPDALATSLRRVNGGERVAVHGAAGELHWDGVGALKSGTLETWCLEGSKGVLQYGQAPLTYDVASMRLDTRSASCGLWLDPQGEPMQGTAPQAEAPAEPPSAAAAPKDDERAAAGAAGQGTAGAGGTSPPVAAPSEPPPADEPPTGMQVDEAKTLVCGELRCHAQAEQCCVAILGLPTESPGDVSCKPRSAATAQRTGAAGTAAPAECALNLQCASDADCAGGAVCCASSALARCVSPEACSAEAGRRLACKSPRECPEGQQCCMRSDGGTSFGATSCAATCDLANVSVRVCEAAADCASDAASTTCNPSALLPALRVCWPRL
jgi:ABC-type branched-subunit amino acid transport system substrate-binding protein